MPYGLSNSAMAKSPDGRGVLLIGGTGDKSHYGYGDRILELNPGASSWSSLQVTLENRRGFHNVIPLQ